jgi:hypothetical protein
VLTKDPKQGVSHLGTATSYPQRVPKSRYSPPSSDVAARIDHVVELYRRQQAIEAEYKAALADLTKPEGDAVPITHIAERLGIVRKTVYRHLGRSMT